MLFVSADSKSAEWLKTCSVRLKSCLQGGFYDFMPEGLFLSLRDTFDKRYDAGLVDPPDHFIIV